MSTVDLTLSHLRLELKVFFRTKVTVAFQFLMPIMFVIVFGSLFGNNGKVGGVAYTTYFVSGMVAVAVLTTSFSAQAITLSFQRETKLLKRLRGTPLGATALFAAKILTSAITACAQIAIILVLGRVAYHIAFPRNWPAFIVAIVFGVLVFSTIGVAYSAFTPNADAAVPMVQLPFIVMQFISGLFFPFQAMPRWMQVLGSLLPLRWFIEIMRAAYIGFDYSGFLHDDSFRAGHVHGLGAITSQGQAYLILSIWFVAGLYVAVTRFRWENRG